MTSRPYFLAPDYIKLYFSILEHSIFRRIYGKTNFLYYDRLMIEYKETKHSLVYKANSDLSLYSAGYEECTPGYSYGPTLRSYQLIHFVLNGEGVFRINEHVFHLKAGDAFLIPAGKITYYEASKQTLGLMHGSALSASARKAISIRL